MGIVERYQSCQQEQHRKESQGRSHDSQKGPVRLYGPCTLLMVHGLGYISLPHCCKLVSLEEFHEERRLDGKLWISDSRFALGQGSQQQQSVRYIVAVSKQATWLDFAVRYQSSPVVLRLLSSHTSNQRIVQDRPPLCYKNTSAQQHTLSFEEPQKMNARNS